MIESSTLVPEDILLQDEDFPESYINMQHPSDYIQVSAAFKDFICHSRLGRHNRLIVRLCWKLSDSAYLPISFVCDTGAPSHLYLSNKARSNKGSAHETMNC